MTTERHDGQSGRIRLGYTDVQGGTLMLSAEDNDLLCRVEGAAPMGQIARPAMPVSLLEGASDTAVLQFRRIMLEAVRDFQATGRVIGRGEPFIPHAKLRSFGGVVPMTQDWRTLGVAPEELALAPISEAAE